MNIKNLQKAGKESGIILQWFDSWYDGPLSGWLLYNDKWCYFEMIGDYLLYKKDNIEYYDRLYGIYPATSEEVAVALQIQIYQLLVFGSYYTCNIEKEIIPVYKNKIPKWYKNSIIFNEEENKKEPSCDYLLDIFRI